MTAEEWLQLDDKTLALELAKVLTPGPWKHKFDPSTKPGICKCSRCAYKCGGPDRNCQTFRGVTISECNKHRKSLNCSIPDPIDSSKWDVAMEWRDKLPHRPFRQGIIDVWAACTTVCTPIDSWLMGDARPKHYLIAAALSKHEVK